jgi:hypothetical protein
MSGQSGIAAHGYEFVTSEPTKPKKKMLHEDLEMYADKESQHRFVVKRQTSGDSRNQTSVHKSFYHVLMMMDDLFKSGSMGSILKSKLPIKEVLKVIHKPGYEIRHEVIDGDDYGSPDITMRSTYNANGDYIGDPRIARMLAKRGISPEKSDKKHNVCSIGYSEKDGKWYGWSHRAISGFKIGDKVKRGDCTASSGWTEEYLKEHPEENKALPIGFTAKTLEDAKKMAIAFAESVG